MALRGLLPCPGAAAGPAGLLPGPPPAFPRWLSLRPQGAAPKRERAPAPRVCRRQRNPPCSPPAPGKFCAATVPEASCCSAPLPDGPRSALPLPGGDVRGRVFGNGTTHPEAPAPGYRKGQAGARREADRADPRRVPHRPLHDAPPAQRGSRPAWGLGEMRPTPGALRADPGRAPPARSPIPGNSTNPRRTAHLFRKKPQALGPVHRRAVGPAVQRRRVAPRPEV